MFTESLRPSFDGLRRKARDFPELRDPLLVRTQYDEVVPLRLGPAVGVKGVVEQRGLTGGVDAFQRFVAPTARFKASDVGKELFTTGSQFPQNNRRVTIASLSSATVAVTDPPLVVDAGPLRWELRTRVVAPTDRVTVEVRSGDVGDIAPGWILFDGFADFTVVGRRQFKLPIAFEESDKQLLTEQEGLDGNIDSSGRFQSVTVRFDQKDVGKRLVLGGSALVANNGVFEVVRIVTVGVGDLRAVLDADPTLEEDQGLVWAVLPHAELDLENTVVPRGAVDQEGSDLSITASSPTEAILESPSATFEEGDLGKIVTVSGSQTSPSNDGSYEIVAVVSSMAVQVAQRAPALIVEGGGVLSWEVRTPTALGDLTRVDVRAPSLLTYLAGDFGIEVDTQESEARQRSWVKSVSEWIKYKGTHDGYRIIGAISGFDITTFQLYRFAASLTSVISPDHLFEVESIGVGRFGADGTLAQDVSLRYRFSSPTAAFAPTDVDSQVRVRNAGIGGNNKLYTIETVISAHEVEFLATDGATLPEANNGALRWNIVRLYTDLAPLLPNFDEVNGELLKDIVNGGSGNFLDFALDKYCWEDDFDATAHISVVSVATVAPGVHRVTVSGTGGFPTTPEIVLAVGQWQFVSLVAGVTGTGDTVMGGAPLMILEDLGAAFTVDMVGKWLSLSGATSPANNGFFLVTACLSPVRLEFFNGLGVGEGFPGTWQLFDESEFFIDSVPVLAGALSAPSLAVGTGDSFAKLSDVMTLTDAGGLFVPGHVGKHLHLAGATSAGNNGVFLIETYVSPTQIQYRNAAGIAEAYAGAWNIGLGLYSFNVAAALPPAAPTPAKLRYKCPVSLSCGYCGASKVFAQIEATAALLSETGSAVERILERVLLRLEDVTPAHVELIALFRQTVDASLTLTATVSGEEIDASLLAPLSAFYDEIPGDELPGDTVLTATIEQTLV